MSNGLRSNEPLFKPSQDPELEFFFDGDDQGSDSMTELSHLLSAWKYAGYSANQGTGANQPEINVGGGDVGGRKAVRFTIDKYLVLSIAWPTSGNFAITWLANDLSLGVFNFAFESRDITNDYTFGYIMDQSFGANESMYFQNDNMATSVNMTRVNGVHVRSMVFDYDNGTVTAYRDGVQIGQATDYTIKAGGNELYIGVDNDLFSYNNADYAGMTLTKDISLENIYRHQAYFLHQSGYQKLLPDTNPWAVNPPTKVS